jgi:hypothetical protein
MQDKLTRVVITAVTGCFILFGAAIMLHVVLPADAPGELVALALSVVCAIPLLALLLTYYAAEGPGVVALPRPGSAPARGWLAQPAAFIQGGMVLSALLSMAIIGSLVLPWGSLPGTTPTPVSGFDLVAQPFQPAINASNIVIFVVLLIDLALVQILCALSALRAPLLLASAAPRLGIFAAFSGMFVAFGVRVTMGDGLHAGVQPILWLPFVLFAAIACIQSAVRAVVWMAQEHVPRPVGQPTPVGPGIAVLGRPLRGLWFFPRLQPSNEAYITHPVRVRRGAIILAAASLGLLGTLFLPIISFVNTGMGFSVVSFPASGFDFLNGNIATVPYIAGWPIALIVIYAVSSLCLSLIVSLSDVAPDPTRSIPPSIRYQSRALVSTFIVASIIFLNFLSTLTNGAYPLSVVFSALVVPFDICLIAQGIGGIMILSGSGITPRVAVPTLIMPPPPMP